MAHSVKYRIEYSRLSGNQTTIDILKEGYSGAVTSLQAGGTPLVINFEGEFENIYKPTTGTGATIKVQETPLSLLDLYTEDPQEYKVIVYDGTSEDSSGADNIRWQGFVNTGIFTEGYSNPLTSEITIYCNDGMSLLDNIQYTDTSDVYSGTVTLAAIIDNVLGKIAVDFDIVYTSNDIQVLWDVTNLIANLSLANENFVDESSEAMSCRRVLDSMLGGLGGLVMWFKGDAIYIVDPINLHDTTKGKSYDLPNFDNETVIGVGGYLDVASQDVTWGKTGSGLDVVDKVDIGIVNYNPYNFTSAEYTFSDSDNWDDAGTFADDYNFDLNSTIEYTDWTFDSLDYMARAMRKDTYTLDEEYVIEFKNWGGIAEYTFASAIIVQDSALHLRVSMQVYAQTKRDSENIFDAGIEHDINRIMLPFAVKIGDQFWKGGNHWDIIDDSTKWQEWWLTGSELKASYADETFNDAWTEMTIDFPMFPTYEGNFLSGNITVQLLDEFTDTFADPVLPFTEACFDDDILNIYSNIGEAEVGFARVSDTIIDVTITSFPTYMGIDDREYLFDDAVTAVSNNSAGDLIGGNYDDGGGSTVYGSDNTNTLITVISYTHATNTLVFRCERTSGVYFNADFVSFTTGVLNNIDYAYDYKATLLFFKDIQVEVLDSNTRVNIGNNGIEEKAIVNANPYGKKEVKLEVTSGAGPYGCSRGALKSSALDIAGDNIDGLYRGDTVDSDSDATVYTPAKLLLQSFMSQYKAPRFTLKGRFDAQTYDLSIRTKLIKDTGHLSSKAFYPVRGSYYDREEMIDVEAIEVTDTRDAIT